MPRWSVSSLRGTTSTTGGHPATRTSEAAQDGGVFMKQIEQAPALTPFAREFRYDLFEEYPAFNATFRAGPDPTVSSSRENRRESRRRSRAFLHADAGNGPIESGGARGDARALPPAGHAPALSFGDPDNDPLGPWASMTSALKGGGPIRCTRSRRPAMWRYKPPSRPSGECGESSHRQLSAEGRMWFGKDGRGRPRVKTYLLKARVIHTLDMVATRGGRHTRQAKRRCVPSLREWHQHGQ